MTRRTGQLESILPTGDAKSGVEFACTVEKGYSCGIVSTENPKALWGLLPLTLCAPDERLDALSHRLTGKTL